MEAVFAGAATRLGMLLCANFVLFSKLVIVGLPCAGLSGPSADSPSANVASSAVTCIVMMMVDLLVRVGADRIRRTRGPRKAKMIPIGTQSSYKLC